MTASNMLRTEAPEAMAIDRESVWAHLRSVLVETDASPPELEPVDAAYIDTLIASAVDYLDGPKGLLNRALITQTWAAYYDCFDPTIIVPLARCQSVESIVYIGLDDSPHVLPESAYRVTGIGRDRCLIRPAIGTTWPATISEPDCVTVTFTAGFGDTAADVPPAIRHAMLEAIARAYSYSEDVIDGRSFSRLPGSAAGAVSDWTVWPSP